MTNQDFINLQAALGLSGKELADKLGVTPAAVSKWRTEREIPPYIAKAMEKLVQEVEIVVPLNVVIAVSRMAEQQGVSFEKFLGTILRNAADSAPANVTPISPPKPYDLDPAAEADKASGRAADQEPKP